MKTRHRIKKNVLYMLNALLWAFSSFPEVQRKKPININFVFHTEAIANKKTFDELINFCKKFLDHTQAKVTLCVTTPYCLMTELQLEEFDITAQEYERRVKSISEFAEIGYHGHFFTPLSNKHALVPINHLNYNFQLISKQMHAEIKWFKEQEMNPITYVAGWWFLTDDIIAELEGFGIRVDCSIRRNHTNTFGEKFVEDDKIPQRGEPFILSPSQKIIEIQSVFYPIHHPRLTLNMLKNVIDFRPNKELFIVFPSHEGELLEFNREFWANIKMLTKLDYIKWTNLSEMNRLAREEWKL